MSVLVCKHTWQPCCLVDGFSMDWAFTAYTFTLHIWGLILNHFSSTPWVLQALLECLLYSNSKVKALRECFYIHIFRHQTILNCVHFILQKLRRI